MQYKLILSSEQAHTVNKAVELLMRLKIGQFEEIPMAIAGGKHPEEFFRMRAVARPHLDGLRRAFEPYHKDDEWHRLYDLHQVIRKCLHDVEAPESVGVDSYPAICTSGEKLARMEVSGDGT